MSKIFKRFKALWLHKCPRCYTGDLFMTGAFSFKKPFDMPPRCNKCGLNFFPEPGFYYGAMFTSYIITSFFSLGVVGFCILVLDWSVEASFALLIGMLAVLFVWFYRTARAAWIHMTVRHDPNAIRNYNAVDAEEQFPDYVGRNF